MNPTQESRYALVVKKQCPTCALIEPLLEPLDKLYGSALSVYVQDDPAFAATVTQPVDDSSLEFSWRHQIEIVPTLIHFRGENEVQRIAGWDKKQWRELTGIADLGEGITDFQPGCGSRTQDPGMEETLALRFAQNPLQSRELMLDDSTDAIEACYDHGWTDGLPVVPPTPLRVMRMLNGSERDPREIIGAIPPDLVACSVEKIAINAVMAGCKPEYFPVVLATVEAALQDPFCLHGLLCTTYFSSPVIVVNGPVSRHIGMNWGINALGQGNRANATIGRALQLLVRNVGGGIPGEIDRATLGNPGKYTYCFAEDESDEHWPSLAMDRGFERKDSVVNLFAGDGLQPIVDQRSRTADSLSRSMALSLRSVVHCKLFQMADAILVICPEHRRVFKESGWNKADVKAALIEHLQLPGAEIVRGAGNIAEGMPETLKDQRLAKFRDDGLHIVAAGGDAGFFSAVIGGWVASGERGSQLVSQRVN
ncbi:MAG: thioredoxin family protein [Pseudohongiellaceae bacterium]